MSRRVPEWIRGLGALVATLALVVVPPLGLALAVGWPLPTRVPDLDQLAATLERGIEDVVVVKVLACVAWLAWLQVAATVAVEVVAYAGSRPAPRLPVLPGVQVGVARLVATSAVVLSSFSIVRPAVAALPQVEAVANVQGPAIAEVSVIPSPQGSQEPTEYKGKQATHTVARGETLWDIAETVLGDGMRWREVRDLNVGRTMSDGSVVGADSDLVRPGWVLLVPAPPPGEAALASAPSVTLERGDHLWAVAADVLAHWWGRPATDQETRPYWEELVQANRDHLADPSDPDLVFAGQQVLVPPAPTSPVRPGPAPTTPPPAEEAPAVEPPGPPSGHSPPVDDASEAPPEERTQGARPLRARERSVPPASSDARPPKAPPLAETVLPEVRLLGVAGTALAVGVAHSLRRRRRRRLRHHAPGNVPAPPPEHLDDVRVEVDLAADEDQVASLDLALRSLSAALGHASVDSRPRLVQLDQREVEVLLSEPVELASGPWRTEAAGSIWVGRGLPQPAVDEGAAPAPLLVTLGEPEDGRQLYLDLEAQSVVSVTGDPATVAGLVRSILLELSTSVLGNALAVRVVGDAAKVVDEKILDALERVRAVPSWEDAAEDILAWSTQAREALAANRWPNTFVARSQADHDGIVPHLAICFERPDPDSLAQLVQSAGTGAVTVLLVGDHVPGALRIEAYDERLTLPDLGAVCRVQSLDDPVLDQVVELLEDADDPSEMEVPTVLVDGQLSLIPGEPGAEDHDCEPASVGEYRDPEHHVLVRLLGDITVEGGTKSLTAKQTAVAAFVALHAPVASERVEDAIWTTPTASRRKRLANNVSACRTILGAAHFPVASDGRYSVGPKLATDVGLFERRLAAASRQEPEDAVGTLKGALELVRGPLFSYRSVERSSYVWIDLENWVSTWEVKVIDTALHLAQLCLDVGDIDGAIWAAGKGLVVAPVHTGLTESLMASYHERGDRLAAERVYRSHLNALEALEIDDVAETTMELYEQIRARAAG